VKRVVLTVGVAALVLGLAACPTDVDLGHIDETPSLSVVWGDYFPMGNIVAFQHHRRPGDIGNSARWALLRRHFDILTAEDEMKPDHIQASRGSFTWARGDRIVNETLRYGMRMHGHTLAWHSQSPWWMNQTSSGGGPIARDQAIDNLVTHIERVMRHFGPRVESWDVLNEIFASGGGPAVVGGNWRNNLRTFPGPPPGSPPGTFGPQGPGTPWARAIGTFPHDTHDPNRYCYIWIAFTTARRVADEIDTQAGRPLGTTILYYNDYNEELPNKRAAIFYMVQEMNQRFAAQNNGRRLIDAIGMQAHYHRAAILELGESNQRPSDHNNQWPVQYPWATNIANVRASLWRFAELDVSISITELDITVGNTQVGNFTPVHEREQAIMYARLFQIFREFADAHPDRLRRVTFWGIDDPGSWRFRGSPHLWDGRLRPKEAFWAVAAPDAFVNPENGQTRSAAEINAFLADPRASGFIPENAWGPR